MRRKKNEIKNLLSKKHICVIEISEIWQHGEIEDKILLIKRLFEEYRDYTMIVNLINKEPILLYDSKIKEIYEFSKHRL